MTACQALRKDVGGFMHIHGNVTGCQPKPSYPNNENSDGKKLPSQNLISERGNEMPRVLPRKSKANNMERLNFDKTLQRLEWNEWATLVSVRMKEILEEIDSQKWNVSVIHVEHIKSYAPHVDHIVADIQCRPTRAS